MGALSSWAMLAITHHYIIQYSAWVTFVTPTSQLFTEYAVLGDDVVIWNRVVAKRYISVMKQLGVELNLAKSIISTKGDGLEFAKRTLYKGTDVSPIPFKEMSASHQKFANLRTFSEKYNLTPLSILRYLGYGYKVDPTKNSLLVKSLSVAFAIPRTANELLSLFSYSTGFYDWLSTHIPHDDIRRLLVKTVASELGDIKFRAKESMWKLLQLRAAVATDAIGPWRDEVSVVRDSIIGDLILKYVSDLEVLTNTAQLHLTLLRRPIDHFNGIFYDLPHHPYTNNNYLRPAINFIMSGQKELDAIQVDLLYKPSPRMSVSPSYVEEQRTVRLWNK